MVLSRLDIKKEMEKGAIEFSPDLEPQQWAAASINLRLGFKFTKLRAAPGITVSVAAGIGSVGSLGLWDEKILRESDELGNRESYELFPGQFVLALTHEAITVPRHLIARVEGRSTYARMGLSMHQTAPWVQPGFNGPLVLEIANLGSFTIKLTPLVDRPCQLTFFRLVTAVPEDLAYGSRPTDLYQGQSHARAHGKPRTKPKAKTGPKTKTGR
jgi:dCTP deaminase